MNHRLFLQNLQSMKKPVTELDWQNRNLKEGVVSGAAALGFAAPMITGMNAAVGRVFRDEESTWNDPDAPGTVGFEDLSDQNKVAAFRDYQRRGTDYATDLGTIAAGVGAGGELVSRASALRAPTNIANKRAWPFHKLMMGGFAAMNAADAIRNYKEGEYSKALQSTVGTAAPVASLVGRFEPFSSDYFARTLTQGAGERALSLTNLGTWYKRVAGIKETPGPQPKLWDTTTGYTPKIASELLNPLDPTSPANAVVQGGLEGGFGAVLRAGTMAGLKKTPGVGTALSVPETGFNTWEMIKNIGKGNWRGAAARGVAALSSLSSGIATTAGAMGVAKTGGLSIPVATAIATGADALGGAAKSIARETEEEQEHFDHPDWYTPVYKENGDLEGFAWSEKHPKYADALKQAKETHNELKRQENLKSLHDEARKDRDTKSQRIKSAMSAGGMSSETGRRELEQIDKDYQQRIKNWN